MKGLQIEWRHLSLSGLKSEQGRREEEGRVMGPVLAPRAGSGPRSHYLLGGGDNNGYFITSL